MVLGFSELRAEDRPDPAIWLDDDALAAHFAAVRAKYAEQSAEDLEDDPAGYVENPAAAELLRRIG